MFRPVNLAAGRLWPALRPRVNGALGVVCAAFAAAELVLIAIVLGKHRFDWTDGVVALALAHKVLFDLALFVAPLLLLARVVTSRVPAVAFAGVTLFATLLDAAIYLYGNTLFERDHLDLIAWYALKGFAGLPVLGLLLLFGGGTAAVAWALPALRRDLRWGSVGKWGGLLLVVALACTWDYYAGGARGRGERLDRHTYEFRNEQLRYATQNSLVNFVRELGGWGQGTTFNVTTDPASFADVISEYQLPLGRRSYADLGLEPFRRVVLFVLESLSLDLVGAHNDALPIEPMPFFFGSPEIARQTFTDVRTTAQPTLEGLSVTFTSHPNYGTHRIARAYDRQDAAQRPVYYRLAFPRLLAEAGFQTVFLRSASRYYAHENIVFGDLGFERVMGREDFFSRPEMRDYIYGWGLEDRLLYRELVALLEEHREEKIFVAVLGADTHPPLGRLEFRNLDYPPLPDGFVETYGERPSRFLTAMHHLDFDIGNAIEAIRDAGLFDEQTLIILTADHACPFNPVVRALPGYPRTSLARIPVVLLSGQPLPGIDFSTRGSQLDLAPTIFHLLGLPVPPGWWGDSLLAPDRRETYVGFDRSMLFVEHGEEATVVNLRNPPAGSARLVDLFNTIIVTER